MQLSGSCPALSKTWKAEQLLWRSWTDEHIVYNVSSGNTHVITPIAVKVLKFLQDIPSTRDQIAQHLVSENGIDLDDELVTYVERLVADLDKLGLVLPLS
jgi:PqqD family protein of HPr-rel-A system